jgi:eukaryotic-like serine/threonine-protein kinase
MTDLINHVINNFVIQEVIGQGGMGIVYRAYHPDLMRYAAVKVMRPELSDQPGFYERFLQEARAAAHLDHPNIVDVINFGRYRDFYYLMMDFIEGPTLRQLVNEHPGGLPLWDVVQIFAQIADVLTFAHAAGVLHRDLKPDNILLTTSLSPDQPYRAVVTDFGLVKLAKNSLLETQTGISVGTPAYMSPEQCRGDRLTGQSDIYSLGVMLYETILGRRPYPIRNLFDAARFHASGKLVPLRAHNPTIPIKLDALVGRMMAPETSKRPSAANEVVKELHKIAPIVKAEDEAPQSQIQMRIDALLRVLVNELDQEKLALTIEEEQVAADSPHTPPSVVTPPKVEYSIQVQYHDQLEEKIYPVKSAPLLVGRTAPADIILDRPERYVSKQHCEILLQGARVLVRDLGSTNGTFLGSLQLERDVFYEWEAAVPIYLGPFTLNLRRQEIQAPPPVRPALDAAPPDADVMVTKIHTSLLLLCRDTVPDQIPFTDKPITIGRAPDCDMVLNFAQVSKYHCRVQRQGHRIELVDLNSTNGTFWQGQRLPANTPIIWEPQTSFTIGPAEFTMGGQKDKR